jgi:hypothetical protein
MALQGIPRIRSATATSFINHSSQIFISPTQSWGREIPLIIRPVETNETARTQSREVLLL